MANSVPLTALDKALEFFGALSLLVAVAAPLFYYSQIPDIIPIHFNFAGMPDDYGAKIHIVIVPWIGVVMYTGLFLVKRYSSRMNYPVPVTDDNREILLTLTLQMMRWIRFIIAVLFLYLVTSMVQIGLGVSERASIYIVVYFLLALLLIVSIYVYRMIQQHTESED
jgi:uncharacterized membrane protein